jgi:hypothetical protein
MTLQKQDKEDIKTILAYLWDDEKRHYEESGKPLAHIFLIMKRLAKVVNFKPL